MTKGLKPIEPGCVAMIVNSRMGHSGKFVTVGKRLGNDLIEYHDGAPIGYDGGPWWEIDKSLDCMTNEGEIISSAIWHEGRLRRMDGHKKDQHDAEFKAGHALDKQNIIDECNNRGIDIPADSWLKS